VEIARLIAMPIGGICVCLALVAPIYRHLHFLPMLFPRCPFCKKRPNRLYYSCCWPRIRCGCSECHGEFVVWLDGQPTVEETWDTPVLALKWPYVYGRYKRVEKPETAG
jgi:hypothetical protein